MALGPTLWGRYERGPLLGVGGSGEVYQGQDLRLNRLVALKFLRAETAVDADLRRERCALRILDEAGINPLFDEGMHEGRGVLVMPLIQGSPFPGARPDRLPELVVQLLRVLSRVHALGLHHRDIKPSNVLVDDAGVLTVLDFGLASGAAVGRPVHRGVSGTPRYAAPEQLWGQAVGAPADLYAVGLMVGECVGLPRRWLDDPALRVVEDIPFAFRGPLKPLTGVLAGDPNRRPSAFDLLLALGGADGSGPSPPIRTPAALPTAEAAERTLRGGDSGRALRILGALGAMRLDAGGLFADEIALLVRAAVRRLTPAAIDRAMIELERTSWLEPPHRARLRALLHAAWVAARGDGERAWTLMEDIEDAPPELAWGIRVRAAANTPERWNEIAVGLQRDEARLSKAWARNWIGLLRYRQGRFDEAVAAHSAAAAVAEVEHERLACLLNQAAAHLERGDHGEVVALTGACHRSFDLDPEDPRLVSARVLDRAARYRRGDPMTPDPTFVERVARHKRPDLVGYAALTEAAIAWRNGADPLALLNGAVEAYSAIELRDGWLLARAFQIYTTGVRATSDAERNTFAGCALPRVRLQAAALTSACDPPIGPVPTRAEVGPTVGRLEILSVAECYALALPGG